MKCSVCGKTLSQWDGKTVCSNACKQKRYRIRSNFGQNAIKAGQKMREMVSGLKSGGIETQQAIIAYNDLRETLDKIYDEIRAQQDRENAQQG